MAIKTILLIVASQGYQHVEYGDTRKVLESAGMRVLVGSDVKGTAYANPSSAHSKSCNDSQCGKVAADQVSYGQAKVDVILAEIDAKNYDGIFIVGGPGALEFLDNPIMYKIVQSAARLSKPFGAICISPRILAKAGVLINKRATGWDGDHQIASVLKQNGAHYTKNHVVTDGIIVTADGPAAAIDFGKAIVNVINGK